MLSDPADDRPRGRALDAAWWIATGSLVALLLVVLVVRLSEPARPSHIMML